jgi:hypothetical protein
MITANFRYPTREEIDALVRAARRERAQAIAGFFRDAFSLLAGPRARRRPSRFAISSAKERPMTQSFWKTAAASLPPQIQWRYAGLFEVAERYEILFDIVATSGGRARRALAQTCRGIADALRNTARALDVAARRLTPSR